MVNKVVVMAASIYVAQFIVFLVTYDKWIQNGGLFSVDTTHIKPARNCNHGNSVLSDVNLTSLEHGHLSSGGCALHTYSTREVRQCMQKLSSSRSDNTTLISFWGDSRTISYYTGLRTLISGRYEKQAPSKSDVWSMYNNTDINTFLKFHWLPLPRSMNRQYQRWDEMYQGVKPHVLIFGFASHILMHDLDTKGLDACLKDFQDSLHQIAVKMSSMDGDTQFIWHLQDPVNTKDAKVSIRFKSNNKTKLYFTNEIIEKMNNIALKVLSNTPIAVWKSNRRIAEKYIDFTEHKDGAHIGVKARYWDSQILMNYICNKFMDFGNDGICCRTTMDKDGNYFYKIISLEFITFSIFTTGMVRTLFLHHKKTLNFAT